MNVIENEIVKVWAALCIGEIKCKPKSKKTCRCNQKEKTYIYCFVRQDIPTVHQIIQTGHACQESGAKFGCPPECYMTLIGVKDQQELQQVADYLQMHNIDSVMFNETDPPEAPMGYTSICTEPIYGATRRKLKKYQLYRP